MEQKQQFTYEQVKALIGRHAMYRQANTFMVFAMLSVVLVPITIAYSHNTATGPLSTFTCVVLSIAFISFNSKLMKMIIQIDAREAQEAQNQGTPPRQ
jgi:maltodextrin utilization protein YvdJ